MNNNIRVLNDAELSSVAGGYAGFDVIPDPVVPNFNYPLPGDKSPDPIPDPSWNWYLNPGAWGVPTPEPALPKIGKP